ncbi:hypothetical protein SARC_01032 [Sphaeroforma arctica JP610]|uniref:Uncharacterized protein n=1 Tax=Sphaeroforma arctica JP610 TaxID=667725 RepID=A0A0L0GD54_9EUKA|nr:hypothetical protein SARC_01032 [Sphaeroforma arctica JP610]KNC86839.1 hypothetical protein SARC_01032 [Sphaeroforma arctica JP610]|eukprot:XP_014160741.1 hypothetical protein SARC_01032 [Sphaeroforma arctica JP610]
MCAHRQGQSRPVSLADDVLNLEDINLSPDDTNFGLILLQSVESIEDVGVKARVYNDLKEKVKTINTLKMELQHLKQEQFLLNERNAYQKVELKRLANIIQAINEALKARDIELPEVEGWTPHDPENSLGGLVPQATAFDIRISQHIKRDQQNIPQSKAA